MHEMTVKNHEMYKITDYTKQTNTKTEHCQEMVVMTEIFEIFDWHYNGCHFPSVYIHMFEKFVDVLDPTVYMYVCTPYIYRIVVVGSSNS